MFTPQTFSIAWIEFSIVSAILLFLASWIAKWFKHPADLIQWMFFTLIATASSAPLILCLNDSGWHLAWLSPRGVSEVSPITPRGVSEVSPITPRGVSERSLITAHSVSEGSRTTARSESDRPSITTLGTSEGSPITTRSVSEGPPTSQAWILAASLIALAYGIVATWYTFQYIAGRITLKRIHGRSEPPNAKLTALWRQLTEAQTPPNGLRCTLRISQEIHSPMVYGLKQPVVLFPDSFAKLDDESIRFCLRHELSHIQRNDLFRWQIVDVLRCLLWVQPMYWKLRSELRLCQDFIADAYAVSQSNRTQANCDYSELLVSLALQNSPQPISNALAFHESGTQLSRRIRMLFQNPLLHSRSASATHWMAGIAIFLLLTMASSSVRLTTAKENSSSQSGAATLTEDSNEAIAVENLQKTAPTGEEQTPARRLRGQVLDLAGNPVPNATVWINASNDEAFSSSADANGNFEILYPPDMTRAMSPTRTVFAYAPGYSLQNRPWNEESITPPDQTIAIALPPASKSKLRILDSEGNPLSGATVTPISMRSLLERDTNHLKYAPRESWGDRATFSSVTITPPKNLQIKETTDENGEVLISQVQALQLEDLFIEHASTGKQMATLHWDKALLNLHEFEKNSHPTILMDPKDGLASRDVKLEKTWQVQGRVLGTRAEIPKDLKLTFIALNEERNRTTSNSTAIVNADGTFRSDRLAGGEKILLNSNVSSDSSYWPVVIRSQKNHEKSVWEIDVELKPTYKVHGRIIEKRTAVPVGNTQVSLSVQGSISERKTLSDEQGVYTAYLPAGGIHLGQVTPPKGYKTFLGSWNGEVSVPENGDGFVLPKIEVDLLGSE